MHKEEKQKQKQTKSQPTDYSSVLLVSPRHPASRWEAQRLSAADRLPRREDHQSLCREHRRLPVSADLILCLIQSVFCSNFPLLGREKSRRTASLQPGAPGEAQRAFLGSDFFLACVCTCVCTQCTYMVWQGWSQETMFALVLALHLVFETGSY